MWRDLAMARRFGFLVCLAMSLVSSCRTRPPLTPVIERQERWLACRLGAQQVLIVKGAAKDRKPDDLLRESPAAEWLFYVVFSKDVGIAAVSLESGPDKQTLPSPTHVFKMPTSPLVTHFFSGREISGRLSFSDRNGREIFAVDLGTSAMALQELPLFWRQNPDSAEAIDWDALPTFTYSSRP
jgi:hypothetical protein